MWWVLTAIAAEPELPVVTLEEAVSASATAPAVRASSAGIGEAEARRSAVASGRGPVLAVSGSVNVWNGPYEIAFALPGSTGDVPPLVVREQVTGSLAARVVAPLTEQWATDARVKAAAAGVDAAEDASEAAVLDARQEATDAWYAALEADGQLEIARARIETLEARVRAAEVALQAGTAARNDVLKAELALAGARQQALQLEVARDAARGRLGLAMGNGGLPVRPAEGPTEPPPVIEDAAPLVALALEHRPELDALRARIRAADASATAASRDRLPRVDAVATWLHTEGQGAFAQRDAGFVGASLDWPVWTWGARTSAVDAARAGTDQLRARLEAAEAGVSLEVRTRVDALGAAVAGFEVASRSVEQAEENLRIQELMRAGGTSTMTELLDADTALIEARSRTAAALDEAWRARAALEHAIGTELEAR
ncbi:MAG: TolC family protein [Alphaproteobacteria bacterium]|nr:TolC family protein [Alphaproteobacteria bacterium]MCB9695428.1 TolC family protein [Alphaproteobacteria bacterium]